jgi:hypothetical protein
VNIYSSWISFNEMKSKVLLQNGTHMIESPLESKFEILGYNKKLVKSGPILFLARFIKFNGPLILMFLKSRDPVMLFWSSLLQTQFKFTYWIKLVKYIFTCIVTYNIGNDEKFRKRFHTHIIQIYPSGHKHGKLGWNNFFLNWKYIEYNWY